MKNGLMVALTAMFLVGCAGAPAWVKKGAGAFPHKELVFYGLGRANTVIESKSLRMEAADNRARADLQRVFDTYSASLMKDYEEIGGADLQRAIRTFSAGHISGAQVVDRYEKDGEMFSLVKLDLVQFRNAMEKAPDLNVRAKEFIRKRAEALFEELTKKEESQQSAAR